MELFSVIEIYDGEVKDIRNYGRDDLARQDLEQRCNVEIDSRYSGSCFVTHNVDVAKVNGQRVTKKKAAASKANGSKGGRPITTGRGIRNPEKRAAFLKSKKD